MPGHAQTERRELADLLLALGPDAATLDEGWTTRDLAAHLVLRERRPAAALGILLPPLGAAAERVRLRIADQPYPRLVGQVRQAPWWSPVSNPLTDELVNTLEFFVHHEDVRRARPDWRPRDLAPGLRAALWRRIPLLVRRGRRRLPPNLVVQSPGHGEVVRRGAGTPVRLVGPPGELVLFLLGRQRAARVDLHGPAEATGRLRAAKLGL